MESGQEKRQGMLVIFAVISIAFLGTVLWTGISYNGFVNLWWWLALLAVVALVIALIVVYRRMFR
jgi:apolipoprotein N-acyltransferase